MAIVEMLYPSGLRVTGIAHQAELGVTLLPSLIHFYADSMALSLAG